MLDVTNDLDNNTNSSYLISASFQSPEPTQIQKLYKKADFLLAEECLQS